MLRLLVIVALMVAILISPAGAIQGCIEYHEFDHSGNVTLHLYIPSTEFPSGSEIIVMRRTVGSCSPEVNVTAASIPAPAPGVDFDSTWSEVVPNPNRFYYYRLAWKTASGETMPFESCGDPIPVRYVGRHGTLAIRGFLLHETWGQSRIVGCEDGCWNRDDVGAGTVTAESMGMTDMELFAASIGGETFNFYGSLYIYGMPSGGRFSLSSYEIAPDGCGPVATERTSWSQLKGSYR